MTSFVRFHKERRLIDISMKNMDDLIKDEKNKALIAEYIYERLYSRFLKIFDFNCNISAEYEKEDIIYKRNVFKEEYKNGFLIMVSCSMLIETFASFLTGQNETPYGKANEMFLKVFKYAEINDNELKIFLSKKDFYKNIRCGLLHQGEVKGGFKITRKGNDLLIGNKINAVLFFNAIKKLLLKYKEDLSEGRWESNDWDSCRLKLRHIINNDA